MSPVGFEPTISAGKRLQTHALDRAAIGTGCFSLTRSNMDSSCVVTHCYYRALLSYERARVCVCVVYHHIQFVLQVNESHGWRNQAVCNRYTTLYFPKASDDTRPPAVIYR